MTQTVLYYTDSSSFGGVEMAVLQHIENLDRNSWRPMLVYHPAAGLKVLLQEARNLDAELVPCPPLPLGLNGVRQIPAFKAMLRAKRPAVFHAHLSWPLACKWGLVTALFERVPAVVATLHLWVETPYTLASRWQESMIAANLGKYITVSRYIALKLEQDFNVPNSKLQVIHSSVGNHMDGDGNHLKLPAEMAPFRDRPVILTVARLVPHKGISILLEAAAQVPEAVFIILGEGPELSALEAQRQELGLENRVVFAGFRQNVPAWLKYCDLFVLPSMYEGVPLSLLEAMAAGKPVIASAIPGNDEAVRHAESGLLVPPGDAGSLASAIRLLLADPELAQRLALAGQACVQREFSNQAMKRQIAMLYSELVD